MKFTKKLFIKANKNTFLQLNWLVKEQWLIYSSNNLPWEFSSSSQDRRNILYYYRRDLKPHHRKQKKMWFSCRHFQNLPVLPTLQMYMYLLNYVMEEQMENCNQETVKFRHEYVVKVGNYESDITQRRWR